MNGFGVDRGDGLRNKEAIVGSLLVVAASIFALFYLLAHLQEDIRPVKFEVEIPAQLKDDYGWDLSACSQDPEVKDGLIYPRCPADGRPLTSRPIIPAQEADIDAAIERAQCAQKSWSKTTFTQRRKVLSTILRYVNDHQDEIVKACCLDSGKTKIDASFGEILVTVEKLQWTIKHGEKALAPSRRTTNLLMCYKKNTVTYEPLGVVAAVFSWNYPFHSWISGVISAIFSGNGIINRPSEQTCWSSNYFLSIVQAALKVCGHDPDIVQNVICLPEVADHLTSHPGIRHITFIGSRAVALKVCASAAKALTPVTVELGGKDAAIVLDDDATIKDIDSIVAIVMRGTYQSAGQNCIGIERVIALPRIYDLLQKKLKDKIEGLRLGSITLKKHSDDFDMGSMINSASLLRVQDLVNCTIKDGAQLITGGHEYNHERYIDGYYFEPTLLANVRPNMKIAQTEVFGPVCALFRANSVDHAIELANSTEYGLGASVFGAATASNIPLLSRIAREVRSGMVSINDFGAYYAVSLPFGGTKGSGYGRFGGEEGLRALCNPKAICEDAWWARLLGIKAEIPGILQYPVKGERGWKACKGIIHTGYSMSWTELFYGIKTLLGALVERDPPS